MNKLATQPNKLATQPLILQTTEVIWHTSNRSLSIRVAHGATEEWLDSPHQGEIYIELQDEEGRCIDEKTVAYSATTDRVKARVLRPGPSVIPQEAKP